MRFDLKSEFPGLLCLASLHTGRATRGAENEAERMDANLVKSWSTTDGVPSQSSSEQAATEHACRALFEEWIDLDGALHRDSCVPDLPYPLPSRAHPLCTDVSGWRFAGPSTSPTSSPASVA